MGVPKDSFSGANTHQSEVKKFVDGAAAKPQVDKSASLSSVSIGVLPATFGRTVDSNLSDPPVPDQVLSVLSSTSLPLYY